jgi:hypothetical protein
MDVVVVGVAVVVFVYYCIIWRMMDEKTKQLTSHVSLSSIKESNDEIID